MLILPKIPQDHPFALPLGSEEIPADWRGHEAEGGTLQKQKGEHATRADIVFHKIKKKKNHLFFNSETFGNIYPRSQNNLFVVSEKV